MVYSEPTPYSIPSFQVYAKEQNTLSVFPPPSDVKQNYVWPMGSRVTFFTQTGEGRNNNPPTPVLMLYATAPNTARPIPALVLHNAIDPVIEYDQRTKTVHCFWWWNGWTPDYEEEYNPEDPTSVINTTVDLPKPPVDHYAPHSVPSEDTPAWFRSVVPKRAAESFDHRRPF